MKKFRPYRAGFIVLYVLGVLCLGEAIHTAIAQSTGSINEYMQSFSLFTYLIAVLAIIYVKMYIITRVEVDDTTFHFVNPVYIKPAPGEKRAMFIFRQGDNDIKVVDKKFKLADIEKYGYIEDLGYQQLDRSTAGEKNKLFPIHEIALVMKDGKRYHMNGGNYSVKQLQGIFSQVQAATGLAPEGKLAEVLKGA